MCFCFQAEDGIRDLVRSRGLGDVYKRQVSLTAGQNTALWITVQVPAGTPAGDYSTDVTVDGCLLYTSDAADERSSVDLGGRRIIKKKKYALPSEYGRETHKSRIGVTTASIR